MNDLLESNIWISIETLDYGSVDHGATVFIINYDSTLCVSVHRKALKLSAKIETEKFAFRLFVY